MVEYLATIWEKRLACRAEGNKLLAKEREFWAKGNTFLVEGSKLWIEGSTEGDKLWAKGRKLWVKSAKFYVKGNELRAEGDKLWIKAVSKTHGNIKMEWLPRPEKCNNACKLETGEIFEP